MPGRKDSTDPKATFHIRNGKTSPDSWVPGFVAPLPTKRPTGGFLTEVSPFFGGTDRSEIESSQTAAKFPRSGKGIVVSWHGCLLGSKSRARQGLWGFSESRSRVRTRLYSSPPQVSRNPSLYTSPIPPPRPGSSALPIGSSLSPHPVLSTNAPSITLPLLATLRLSWLHRCCIHGLRTRRSPELDTRHVEHFDERGAGVEGPEIKDVGWIGGFEEFAAAAGAWKAGAVAVDTCVILGLEWGEGEMGTAH